MTKLFHFYSVAFGLTLILLLSFSHAFSQSTIKITFGDLDTNRISVEEFRTQKDLKTPKELAIDSAFVYFSIPGQNSIVKIDYLPKFDSLKFYQYSNTLIPGATVIFKIFVTNKVEHSKFSEQLSYVFYSMTKGKTPSPSAAYLEGKKLKELNYLSGTIYFTGSYFSNVFAFKIEQGKSDELKKLFDRCSIGTIITFDNVLYKDDKNNIIKRNDSIKL